MNTDIHIELAAPEHVAALQELELLAASRFRGHPVPERVFTQPMSLEVLEAARRAGHLWVAVARNGNPVGFIAVKPIGSAIHIMELDVAPAYGGQGIGTGLMQTVEAWAITQGFDEVTLTTFRDIPWNAPQYSRHGYRIVDCHELSADLARRLEHEGAAGFEGRVAMTKRLSAI